jgi:hypothetical protein
MASMSTSAIIGTLKHSCNVVRYGRTKAKLWCIQHCALACVTTLLLQQWRVYHQQVWVYPQNDICCKNVATHQVNKIPFLQHLCEVLSSQRYDHNSKMHFCSSGQLLWVAIFSLAVILLVAPLRKPGCRKND